MNECSLLGWLTLLVLAITGAILAWYTVETWKLRREAQLQTELQIRPFVSLSIDGEAFERRARLVNIGRGVATNIIVSDVIIDRSMELRGHRGLTHLPPGAAAALAFRVWVRVSDRDPGGEVPGEDHGWNIANALDNNDVAIVATYASLTGQWYETTIRMAQGSPRITNDRRRHAPGDAA